MKDENFTVKEIELKLKKYCSYQDRCHIEVENKLKNFNLIKEAKNQIIFNLINEDYLNETRFCENFVRGKFKIKNWGKIKIKMELKSRKISNINIDQSLKQIHEKEYLEKLDQIFEKKLTSFGHHQFLLMILSLTLGKGIKVLVNYILLTTCKSHHQMLF